MTEQDLEAIRQIVREEIKDALTVKVQDVTHTVKIEKECSNACDWPRCTLKGCVVKSI